MHPVAQGAGVAVVPARIMLRLAGVALLCSTGAAFHSPPVLLKKAGLQGAGGRVCLHPGAPFGRAGDLARKRGARWEGPGSQLRMEGGKSRRVDSVVPGMSEEADPDEEEYAKYTGSMMGGVDKDMTKDTDKVRIFGANLDSKFASRGRGLQSYEDDKVDMALLTKFLNLNNGDLEKAKAAMQKHTEISMQAEEMFRMGVKGMQVGRYRSAVEEFGKAVETVPGGAMSRDGGMYTVWLSQALDAEGKRGEAYAVLRAIKGHEDRDIQKVRQGLEFILNAPKLVMDENAYMRFDEEMLETFKTPNSRVVYAKMKKSPEKYSLEWYMMKPLPPPTRVSTPEDNMALAFSGMVLLVFTIWFSR